MYQGQGLFCGYDMSMGVALKFLSKLVESDQKR